MGGRLGLYLLSHFSDRFGRAVIESASPGLKTESERAARRESDRRLKDRLLSTPVAEFLDDWYDLPLFKTIDRTDPRFQALLARRMPNQPERLAPSLEQMGTGAQPPLWDKLKDLRSRVLFLAGEKDAKFTALANEMTSLCPASQLAIIPGAGHNVHFERPVEYCAEIARFLTAND